MLVPTPWEAVNCGMSNRAYGLGKSQHFLQLLGKKVPWGWRNLIVGTQPASSAQLRQRGLQAESRLPCNDRSSSAAHGEDTILNSVEKLCQISVFTANTQSASGKDDSYYNECFAFYTDVDCL